MFYTFLETGAAQTDSSDKVVRIWVVSNLTKIIHCHQLTLSNNILGGEKW